MTDCDRRAHVKRIGPDPAEADVVLIGLHGRDQTPGVIETTVVSLVADPTISWLLPKAPGGSWYGERFDAPIDANESDLARSIARLAELVDETPVDPAHIVVTGFSQGACLACEFVARHPRRWGGLVAFTGGRMGPPGSDHEIDGDLKGTPVVLTAGAMDPWITPDAIRSSAASFERAGATVTVDLIEGDPDHRIRPAEVDLLRRVIDAARRTGARGNT